MRKYALAGAAAFAMWNGVAFAGDVTGTWKTGIDHGGYAYVRIQPCGSNFCGTITRTFDTKGNEVPSKSVGTRVIWDMKPAGGGSYDGGKILQPATGKIYDAKLQADGGSLQLKACVSVFCGGQTWQRVD